MSHVAGVWLVNTKAPLEIPVLGVNALYLFFYGSYGVSLFFLLSGYLLTWTEEKRARSGTYRLRSYALRRALRLVPAFYVAILLVAFTRTDFPPWTAVLLHLLFLHGLSPYPWHSLNTVFWSLTPEVAFYLILPIVVLLLPRLPQRLVLFGVLVTVSLITRVYMVEIAKMLPTESGVNYVRFLYYLPTTHLWLFLAGVLLRKLVERLDARSANPRRSLAASVLLVSSVSFLMAFPYLGMAHASAMKHPEGMLVDLAVIAFFASALLGAPLLNRVLGWRPLAFVGTISYSLFLLHGSVLFFLVAYGGVPKALKGFAEGYGGLGAWAVFFAYVLVVLAASVAVSWLSYRYIEGPFLRRKPG